MCPMEAELIEIKDMHAMSKPNHKEGKKKMNFREIQENKHGSTFSDFKLNNGDTFT